MSISTEAREENREAERLHQIVISSCVEAGHDVDLVTSRGEHDHQQARQVGPQLPGDVHTVGVGEAEVEENDLGLFPASYGCTRTTGS